MSTPSSALGNPVCQVLDGVKLLKILKKKLLGDDSLLSIKKYTIEEKEISYVDVGETLVKMLEEISMLRCQVDELD